MAQEGDITAAKAASADKPVGERVIGLQVVVDFHIDDSAGVETGAHLSKIIFDATFISEISRDHFDWLSPHPVATPFSAFSEGKSRP